MQQPLAETDFETVDAPSDDAVLGPLGYPPGTGVAAELVRTIGDSWGRRPLHRTGVADISGLLGIEDIDELIDSRTLRVSQLWVCSMGRNLPPSTYMSVGEQPRTRSVGSTADVRRIMTLASEGSPDPVKVAQHLAAGASLTLNQVDQYVPALRAMCRRFEDETHLRCGVILFVTPPSSQAFSLHADPHDIIVMQTHGTKHWEIHPSLWERENDPDAGVRTLTMRPGDMLYVPEGTPHMARTSGDGGLSIHQTVQFNVPRYDAVARRLLERSFERFCEDTGLTGPIPLPRDGAAEMAERIGPALARFAAALADTDVRDLLDRHLESARPPARTLATGRFSAIAAADGITAASELRRTTPLRVRGGEQRVHTVFGRRELRTPLHTEKALMALASTEGAFTPGTLGAAGLDTASLVLLCRRLAREGALTFA
ncbi:cupin domain-containing protein [Streptomyces sp. NPDC048551]|uniref:JmjC domain-containing protein n=1 Tax=Streptomyces sp. NPDC048551 TaxID=3155758 RepID=UPI00341D270F